MFPEKRAGNSAVNQDAMAAALPDTSLIAQLESEDQIVARYVSPD